MAFFHESLRNLCPQPWPFHALAGNSALRNKDGHSARQPGHTVLGLPWEHNGILNRRGDWSWAREMLEGYRADTTFQPHYHPGLEGPPQDHRGGDT